MVTVLITSLPIRNILAIFGFFLMAVVAGFFLLRLRTHLQKLIGASVVTSLLVFYLLNTNFYPQLLKYQGGNELAFATKTRVDAKNVYHWPGIYSSSYNFYTSELRKEFTDSIIQGQAAVWILTNQYQLAAIKEKGLLFLEVHETPDYEITTMQLPFINPDTRQKELNKLLIVRVK